MQRVRDPETLFPKRDSPLGLRELGRGRGKTVEAGGKRGHQDNGVFQTHQGWCAAELPDTMTARREFAQVRARWGSQHWPSGYDPPSLTKELSPIDNCSHRKDWLLPWSLAGYTKHSWEQPHAISRQPTQNELWCFGSSFFFPKASSGHFFKASSLLLVHYSFKKASPSLKRLLSWAKTRSLEGKLMDYGKC